MSSNLSSNPSIEKVANSKTALSPDLLAKWQQNGFLLLEGFYSDDKIARINSYITDLWQNRKKLDARYVIDIFVETDEERRVYFADAPLEARSAPYKLNDLFLTSPMIRDVVAGEKLAPILRDLLSGLPMVCNSLSFEYGSQQDYHFDTFYMPSPTPNKMIASWLALEDATSDNGPLQYYPGSHKIEPYLFSNGSTIAIPSEMPAFNQYMQEQIEQHGLQSEVLLAKKGDLLIWHSQLFHGGSKIIDQSKTRKSLVTHYFTKEDFQDIDAPSICSDSCYMARPAQPVPYEFTARKSWLKRIFS